jgi:polysaccharide biosynthesis/export protein
MKRISRIALVILIPVIALPVSAQKDNSKNKNQQTNAVVAPNPGQTAAMPAANDATYVIGPSDELNINVWEQDALSKVVPVRPDGMISLPLVNDVQAGGKTPMQLMGTLVEKLTALGVKSPQVTVTVTAINSQRVYVTGQVARAGAYPMLPGMNVLQAISSAGGLTLYAKQTKIMILRTENGQNLRLPFNYKDVLNGRSPGANIVLKPGDTIVVP